MPSLKASENMSSLIIILLLAYNIWILSVLMRPPKGTSPQEPLPEVSDKPIYEVVGASKFSMADQEASKVNTEIQFQQAAEEESAEEEVSETDVAFEETKEDSDEVFTDHRIEDVADDEWDEEHRTAETATGHSFNDLGKAVDTARKVRATRKEKLAAGEVLSDIRGTELEEQMKEKDLFLSEKVAKLIDLYIEHLPDVKLKPTIPGRKEIVIPASVEEFNIADFV